MKRALDNPEFEPAERNPKAIGITVLILVAIMLVGGFLIVWKYKGKMGEDYEELKKGRSAMSLGNIRKNYQTKGLDGQIYDFGILSEKVSLITVISVTKPEASQIIIDEMKLAAEHFAAEEDIQMVCISADPESEVSIAELKKFADKAGIPDENWYVLTADNESFSGFIKDGLKLGMISKIDRATQTNVLPDLLRIVDPSLNIRGEIDDFMFGYYHSVEKRTKEEIAADPSLLQNKEVQKVLERHQNAVQYNRDRMYKNIRYILDHEDQVPNFTEKNNSNRYDIPLIVFSGFVLFVLFMGLRVKKSRAGK